AGHMSDLRIRNLAPAKLRLLPQLVAIVQFIVRCLQRTEEEYAMTATAYCALWLATLLPAPAPTSAPPAPKPVHIHTDYYPAYIQARKSGKMLLVDCGTNFDFQTVDAKSLERYVICRVPVDYKLKIEGKEARLIDAPAFTCLQQQAGLAVVDLHNKE